MLHANEHACCMLRHLLTTIDSEKSGLHKFTGLIVKQHKTCEQLPIASFMLISSIILMIIILMILVQIKCRVGRSNLFLMDAGG